MKKKSKSSPKKPTKPAKKKPAAKKPAVKKAVAKKPVKKVAPKKVVKKGKPAKKVIKKPVVKAKPVAKKTAPAKVIAKAPVKPVKPAKEDKKPAPKIVVAKPASKGPAPKGIAPVKLAKKPVTPRPPRKRFVVLPPRPLVPSEIKDDGKNTKGLYKLEYLVTSSPDVLFEFLSTAGGMEKWFAPKVYIKDSSYIFSWGNDEQRQAVLLALKEREFVRFRWSDQSEKRYFEFRLQIDELTNEIALIVSDFADSMEEEESSRLLWNAQIHDLLHALGSS